ncbi:GntR family transcriptional regulator [Streptomyces sp. NBC_01257]|uniref:GntR family transcriptional regulator n=1 Tax=Streptomyces sp. NBC_01257 TaxID=2903799 RepID=UPI002DDAAFC4|nr:GntR family transcriptional regulator [Streptomyces sp. NBC_01257]WRZ69549.1 GntR family transcriptional regulator [Streptomyces sp. NBC_01257]
MAELGAVRRRDAGQAVCDAIRNDVVTRVFTPGDRLTEERLAARYRVSRIPVREALRTLEAEGFVHSRPYGGTFVAELSDKEAEDLLGIRLLIEPFGAERAATRRTAVHLATLELLVAEAREILDAGSSTGLADLNTRFHRVLAEASGSPTLAALVAQLGYKISWVYSVELPRRAPDSWAEHEGIVQALRDQDPKEARDRVADHIMRAQAAYRLRGKR